MCNGSDFYLMNGGTVTGMGQHASISGLGGVSSLQQQNVSAATAVLPNFEHERRASEQRLLAVHALHGATGPHGTQSVLNQSNMGGATDDERNYHHGRISGLHIEGILFSLLLLQLV